MDWMYKPAKPSSDEYLLGRKVDKFVEDDKRNMMPSAPRGIEECSEVFSERIQVNIDMDIAAKRREDPLFQIRQREEEARKKLLQNPVKMKQIQQLIAQKEELNKKGSKRKKKRKKKGDDSGDELMERYLAALSKKHRRTETDTRDSGTKERPPEGHNAENSSAKSDGHDRLNNSEDSESDEERGKKRYGLQLHQSRRKKAREDPRSQQNRVPTLPRERSHSPRERSRSPRKRSRSPRERSWSPRERSRSPRKRSRSPRKRSGSPKRKNFRSTDESKSSSKSLRRQKFSPQPEQSRKMSDKERARKLEEMMENAKWRDLERSRNVKRYAEEDAKEEAKRKGGAGMGFLNSMMAEHAAKSSVEDRIRRNKHNVQRRAIDLDKNFTKQ